MVNTTTALIVSPHADDGELGCGGIIQSLIGRDADVTMMTLAHRNEEKIEEECAGAQEILGHTLWTEFECFGDLHFRDHWPAVRDHIGELIERLDPDLILCPARGDQHEDHQVVRKACLVTGARRSVVGYITPNRRGDVTPNLFMPLTIEQVQKKIRACHCYSAVRSGSQFRNIVLRGQMAFYGALCGKEYAEGFIIERIVT